MKEAQEEAEAHEAMGEAEAAIAEVQEATARV